MTVRRRGQRRVFTIRPVRDPEQDAFVVGIRVGQALDVDLPFDIRIQTGDVGGPSAGLAFALTLLEEFGRDVDHGRRVVVTGALDLDGTVLPVGGIEQKVIGAKRSGARDLRRAGWGQRAGGAAARGWAARSACEQL